MGIRGGGGGGGGGGYGGREYRGGYGGGVRGGGGGLRADYSRRCGVDLTAPSDLLPPRAGHEAMAWSGPCTPLGPRPQQEQPHAPVFALGALRRGNSCPFDKFDSTAEETFSDVGGWAEFCLTTPSLPGGGYGGMGGAGHRCDQLS